MTDIIPVNQTEFEFYNDNGNLSTKISFRKNDIGSTFLVFKTIDDDDIVLNHSEFRVNKASLNQFSIWLSKHINSLEEDDVYDFLSMINSGNECYEFNEKNELVVYVDKDEV
jgi:hypothetical protein